MTVAVSANGTRDFFVFQGRVVSDVTKLKVLWFANATASYYTTMRALDATAGYQGASGGSEIIGMKLMTANVSAIQGFKLGYGDTDVGIESSSAPTNPVYAAGVSTNGATAVTNIYFTSAQTTDTATKHELALSFTIPENKYPFIRGDSGQADWSGFVYVVEA